MRVHLFPVLLGGAAGLAVVLAGVQWVHPWLTDPTRGVPGFDPDVRPTGGHVGVAACLHCHEGRRSHHAAGEAPSSDLQPEVQALPEDLAGWVLRPGPPATLCDPEGACFEVALAVGSGRHRRAFLLRAEDGRWVRWDREWTPAGWVGPGIHFAATGERTVAGRVLAEEQARQCVACHATPVGGGDGGAAGLTSVRPGVTCEACHGPGWRHVSAVRAGQAKTGRPQARARSALARVRQCGTCHGRPELAPVTDVLSSAAALAERPGAGLLMSACFVGAGGPECTDCHDVHRTDRPTGERAPASCRGCHEPGGPRTTMTCTREPEGQCLTCHLREVERPGTSNRPRYADHWFRVTEDDPGPSALTTDESVAGRARLLGRHLVLALQEEGLPAARRGLLLMRRGILAAMLGEKEPAEAALVEAEKLLPGAPNIPYNLGNVFMTMGPEKATQSIDAFGRALKLSPTHRMARVRMAEVYRRMGDFVSAEDQLQGVVREHPDDPRLRRELGVVLLTLGRTEEAVSALERALELTPGYAQAARDLAVALQKAGRLPEALERWRSVAADSVHRVEARAASSFLETHLAQRKGPGP